MSLAFGVADFPADILRLIFGEQSVQQIGAIRLVCKRCKKEKNNTNNMVALWDNSFIHSFFPSQLEEDDYGFAFYVPSNSVIERWNIFGHLQRVSKLLFCFYSEQHEGMIFCLPGPVTTLFFLTCVLQLTKTDLLSLENLKELRALHLPYTASADHVRVLCLFLYQFEIY